MVLKFCMFITRGPFSLHVIRRNIWLVFFISVLL